MSLLDWILGRRRCSEDVETTLGLIEEISRKTLTTTLRLEERMSAQETALNAALAAVAQNVADVRGGVDKIIAKLGTVEGVDLTEETAALTGLATSLQDAEDKLAAATAEPEPTPEPEPPADE